MSVIVPLVVALLWAAFVLRCAWFLAKVRGWTEVPLRDRIPDGLLADHPALRRAVVGLAHPALFAVTGLAVAIAVPFTVGEFTITLEAASRHPTTLLERLLQRDRAEPAAELEPDPAHAADLDEADPREGRRMPRRPCR